MSPKNPPRVENVGKETVPLQRLGLSTLGRPIPEDRKRAHAAVIRRALRQRRAK